jgi:hypothetical protein
VTILFKGLKNFHLQWIKDNPSFEGQELKIISNNFLSPFLDQVNTKIVSFHFVFGISSTVSAEEVEKVDNNEWFIFPND